jgi:hypothetical protein
VSLACSLLVGAYIVHQHLQPFLSTKPLSSTLRLTPQEIQAILAGAHTVVAVDAFQGSSVSRRRSRAASKAMATHALAVSMSAPSSLDPADIPTRTRRNMAYLSRAASVRTVTKSLSVVVDYNLLVRPRRHPVDPMQTPQPSCLCAGIAIGLDCSRVGAVGPLAPPPPLLTSPVA